MMSDRELRVLVVDDDFMVARVHVGFVNQIEGFTAVGTAHSAREALSGIRRLRPDVVLLDVYLPDGSGLEVLEQLRPTEHGPVSVIVVTAARDVETVSASLHLGAQHYLIKPFRRDDLRERLEHVRSVHRRLEPHGAEADQVQQHEVDRIFGTDTRATATQRRTLPKGLSEVTMREVVRGLRESDTPVSASTLADQLGLSRVSVRRYLDHLVRLGRAGVQHQYGEVGRPQHRYYWVEE